MWIAIVMSCLGPTSDSCTPAVNSKLFETKIECETAVDDVRKYLEANVYYSRAGCLEVQLPSLEIRS
jgi:hypothetical protein